MNNIAPSQNGVSNGNQKNAEVLEQLNPNKLLRHRPLTPLRVFRGVLCVVTLLLTALMMIVYWAPVITLMIRLFSIHYSRKATSILLGTWLSLWPFLFEKINRTKVIFSGDIVPKKERVLLFANHRTEVDWMYIWDLALRKSRLGYIKYVLKSSLMKLPIFGWGFQILEFISVDRKWEKDEPIMRKKLSSFRDPRDPLWLVVFPEGTDYTEKKCMKSQEFAAANGLPILHNLLLPKTKGFFACMEALRNSIDAVYDVTIAYKNNCPTFTDNVFGVDPSEVHMHISRIHVHEIPTSENEAAEWLMERFRLKDQLLSDFQGTGSFPNQGAEEDLSVAVGLINCFVILTMTSIFLYCTIFSSIWFKLYVAFSCGYITILTHFDLQVTPILAFVKASYGSKKNS